MTISNKILNICLNTLKIKLRSKGFDIFHIFPTSIIPRYLLHFLNDNEMEVFNTGLIIGNTKHLWPIFIHSYNNTHSLKVSSNPLDLYSKQTITATLNDCKITKNSVKYFTNEPLKDSVFIPIQKISHCTNHTIFNESIRLSIHHIYGPWFGFRSLVFFNCPQVETPPILNFKPSYKPEMIQHFEHSSKVTDITEKMKAYIRVRDSVINGQKYRYSEDQIKYHYFKDKLIINKL